MKSPTVDIAIVGMAGLFPEARNLREFWNNIINARDCISEIPGYYDYGKYWAKEDYFAADPAARDKTYGRKAGYLPEVEFDPLQFGIPPNDLEAISVVQLLSLYVARQALMDAQLLGENRLAVREKTGVILGFSGMGETAFQLYSRTEVPTYRRVLESCGLTEPQIAEITARMRDLYIDWNESAFPGFLGNVVAGRISNRFDLGGINCTLDAACASSLAAIKMAMSELAEGSCDAVLTGGANLDNTIFAFMCFTKTPAMSKMGESRPYDADSDGMMLGDGIGMVVLKRLADAERANDRIYAVIKGMGTASDGRAKSIYAPRVEGQLRAIVQTYERTGISPASIQLIEGHGTGTNTGDACELAGLTTAFAGCPPHSIALGSVKSQIGHTRTAAGAASLLKVAMALHHKILPPTIHAATPHRHLQQSQNPFVLNVQTRPWILAERSQPRRAAVSSFGFGGTNYHLVVEEYATQSAMARLTDVPQIVTVHAVTPAALTEKCRHLQQQLCESQEYWRYVENCRLGQIPTTHHRLGFVASSQQQAKQFLSQASEFLEHGRPLARGVYYRPQAMAQSSKIVALFPGQGSQYLHMGSQLVQNYAAVRRSFDELDYICLQRGLPALSAVIYPPQQFPPDHKRQQQQLNATQNAQPAIAALSMGLYKLLYDAGLRADFVVGHSFGELTALWAAKTIDDAQFLGLAIARGQAMAQQSSEAGTMLAVHADSSEIRLWLQKFPGVYIANYNGNSQIVLAGAVSAIKSLREALRERGISSRLLSVSNAFHSPLIAHAQRPFARLVKKVPFSRPVIPVYSNVTARPYPRSRKGIQELLGQHMLEPVQFAAAIDDIYEQGGRIFVEIGPKAVLRKITSDILGDREHLAIALNTGGEDSERQLREAIVQLVVAGLPLAQFDIHHCPVVESPTAKNAITLNGFRHLAQKTQKRRQQALSPSKKTATNDTTFVAKKDRDMSNDKDMPKLLAVFDRQNALDQLQRQFHENQSRYIDLLGQMIANQSRLIENFPDSPHLPRLLESLNQSMQMLQQSQQQYHDNHDRYLANQLELLSLYAKHGNTSAIERTFAIVESAPRSLPKSTRLPAPRQEYEPLPEIPPVRDNQPLENSLRNTQLRPTIAEDELIPLRPRRTPAVPPPPVTPPVVKATTPVMPVVEQRDEIAVDAAQVVAKLREIIGDKTGYPEEMLDMDLDLEADMGIDSIKRVEIIGAMHEEFPDLGVDPEALAEMRTLGEISAYLQDTLAGGAPAATTVANTRLVKPKAEITTPTHGVVFSTAQRSDKSKNNGKKRTGVRRGVVKKKS